MKRAMSVLVVATFLATQAGFGQLPCEEDSVYRQFDYWLGERKVQNAKGEPVGVSSIQKILDGCVILENYYDKTGYGGKSFNYVDPVSGKWRQIWVDNKGGSTEFTGSLDEGTMTIFADVQDKDGRNFRRRLRYFNLTPDSLRQFSERTYDDGKTWYVEYDFTYIRAVE